MRDSAPVLGGHTGDEAVEHGLVEADLLGGHRAVVELVDAVGQLGGDGRLGLGATEHEDAVEGPQRLLALGPAALAVAVAGERGDELRPGADQAGVGEVEDRPEVAEAVLDRRAGEGEPGAGGQAAELLGGVVGRVLDGLGLVEDDAVPLDGLERLDVADGGAVGGDDDVGLGRLGRDLVLVGPGRAVVHHDPELGREPGRLGRPVADDRGRGDDQRGRPAGRADEVGEDRGGLAQAHVEGEAAAEAGGVEEPEPGQRLGLVAAQLAVEAVGRRSRVRATRSEALARRSAAQPEPSTLTPPASGEPSRPRAWRSISAPVSCGLLARSASARRRRRGRRGRGRPSGRPSAPAGGPPWPAGRCRRR